MTNYSKMLIHSSTADIEKYKGLKRNAVDDLNRWVDAETAIGGESGKPTKEELDEEDRLYKKSGDSQKALANHEWYMHNKQWKKEYNEEYYQNNKDYWKKRMDEQYKKHTENMHNNTSETYAGEQTWANMSSAEINYERAKKEYDDFMKKSEAATTPVSSFQLPQRKSLIDRGVNIIHKVFTPVLGILAKLLS